MSTTYKATGYVVVKATRKTWGSRDPGSGLRNIDYVRLDRLRMERPSKLAPDEIAVNITVEVPAEAFAPLTPCASILIPTDLALRGPIGVEANDANPEDPR